LSQVPPFGFVPSAGGFARTTGGGKEPRNLAAVLKNAPRGVLPPHPARDTAQAMSQRNVEASRRAWDRFLADDIPGLLAYLDSEIEVHDVPELPDASVYRGHQGYLDQIENFRQAFSEMAYEPLEFIDGGENVVSVIRATGIAKVGGLEGEVTYAQVETWRDGRIVVIQYFSGKEEALRAAGLPE
jgi:ketosteroid isomerase-like protein